MLAHQRRQCTRIVGVHVGGDVVIGRLRAGADDLLQVFRQFHELRLRHRDFGGEAGLDEAGEVVVLGDLVEAERQVVVRADELGRVQRARLQRREDFARRHVGHRGAELAPHLAAEAGRTEAQALDIGDAGQLVAEPAARLRAGITRQEADNAELVVDFVPELLAAEVAHPGRQFTRGHAERHAGEEAEALALVLPVVRRAVAHFSRTVDHRVECLQRRHHFTGSEQLHGQPATRGPGDAVGEVLRANAEAGKVLRPGGDHAPGDIALCNGRGREAHRCGCATNGGRLEKLASLHCLSSQIA